MGDTERGDERDEKQPESLQKENQSDFTPDYLPIYRSPLSGLIQFPLDRFLSRYCLYCMFHLQEQVNLNAINFQKNTVKSNKAV